VLVKTGDSTLLVKEIEISNRLFVAPRWPIGTRLRINAETRLQTTRS
jgi:hypothetical protein